MKDRQRIVIVGAGDHGRGVLEVFRRIDREQGNIEIIGFVDDHPSRETVDGLPILGGVDWLRGKREELQVSIILAIASPSAKEKIGTLLGPGTRWACALHPRADLAPSVIVGAGCVINSGAVVVYETRIGDHVTINLNATIGHHVEIGDYSTIAPGANVLGKVRIGASVQVHANAVILPSVCVGDGAIIGAGSVVLSNVAAGVTVFGNPARPVPVAR